MGCCGKSKQGPSLPRMAGNFGKAKSRVAVAAVRNESILAGDLLYQNRIEICAGNEILQKCEYYDSRMNRCRHRECGCFIKAKAKLLTEKCPESRW